MTTRHLYLDITPFKPSLKISFKHAQAERHYGESIWVKATREGVTGFGEGCPRTYVAGDELESSIAWAKATFQKGHPAFESYLAMRHWSNENTVMIRRFPSAWCAVEMALLDLFAREKSQSVESLLNLDSVKRESTYSAVLGIDSAQGCAMLADLYLKRGMADFKIKLNGRMDEDREKIDTVSALAKKRGVQNLRIRLDANNLWDGQTGAAIRYFEHLDRDVFAVEEPVRARDVNAISRFSTETGMTVILDESLLSLEDLNRFNSLPGSFIANIKVSRVGGLVRTTQLIKALKTKNWPIIIGCHVGESSLLTRAGLIASSAAGDHLIAHEGAFGNFLVAWEPVKPMLRFNNKGKLNLDAPYVYKDERGYHTVPPKTWALGMGMTDAKAPPRQNVIHRIRKAFRNHDYRMVV